MSGLNVFFVRSASGYEMEEFYHSSVEYLCFGDLTCLLAIIKKLLEKSDQIYLVDSKFDVDSPSSYLIDDSIRNSRVLVTERPVRANGFKRMEVVFSGNRISFAKFHDFLSRLILDTNNTDFGISYKLDGIIDEILFPLGVGLSFDKKIDLEKAVSAYDQSLIFPKEIGYMDLPEESREGRISALADFRTRIQCQIDRCHR